MARYRRDVVTERKKAQSLPSQAQAQAQAPGEQTCYSAGPKEAEDDSKDDEILDSEEKDSASGAKENLVCVAAKRPPPRQNAIFVSVSGGAEGG